ncbi:hypothetical protein BJ742DRAFT_794903 [Cladochytrium replicatum]|nr:hypothetical protein BJ742DRAFT_794903 [Cladochytrium replicatum]
MSTEGAGDASPLRAQDLTPRQDLGDSIMKAAVRKSPLMANPWDGGGDYVEDDLESSLISSRLDLPPPRVERSGSKLDQLDLLSPLAASGTLPTVVVDPPISPFIASSTSSLDYMTSSPSLSPMPRIKRPSLQPVEEDPWSVLNQPFGKDLNSSPIPPASELLSNKFASPRPSIVAPPNVNSTTQVPDAIQWFVNLDFVSVDFAPEKGGYVMKYVKYIIRSTALKSTVNRRYSDFVWLFDVLQKRYPYRLLPSLPPKKVNVDEAFLEGRRKGLARFLQLIANHPVLRKDDIVLFFLTDKTEVKDYRKSHNPSTQEEMFRRVLTEDDMAVVPREIDDMAADLKSRIEMSLVHFRELCGMMERVAFKKKEIATDYLGYSTTLQHMTEHSDCIGVQCVNCPILTEGYSDISSGFRQVSLAFNEQSLSMEDGFVESLKSHRDLLEALCNLLERRERTLVGVNFETLNRRIKSNRKKLDEAQVKGLTKDIERLQVVIRQDETELHQHDQRLRFLRLCTWEEMRSYHQQRAFLSSMYQQYVGEEQRLVAQQAEIWKNLYTNIYDLPTSGFI